MLEIRVSRRVVLGAGLGLAGAAAAAGITAWLGASDEDRGSAGGPAELRLATGPEGGVYRAVGGELVKVLAERIPRTEVHEIQTGGSADNLTLLAGHGVELGFAYLDTVAGLGGVRVEDFSAVARMYDAWMHVIVLASSPVRTFRDLDGRAVSASLPGSGTRFTTNRIAELAGVQPSIVSGTFTEGAKQLAAGQVEALSYLTGIPTPAVAKLATDVKLRMIPLDMYTAAIENRYGAVYTPATMPSSVYPGIDATETVTTPTLLLARPDLPASVVERVTTALFAERERIARSHPDANRINVRTAIATAPVRLHPGALHYYQSVKP